MLSPGLPITSQVRLRSKCFGDLVYLFLSSTAAVSNGNQGRIQGGAKGAITPRLRDYHLPPPANSQMKVARNMINRKWRKNKDVLTLL